MITPDELRIIVERRADKALLDAATGQYVAFCDDDDDVADNYIEANPLSTPPHIVPEWYFLPYYAILRAIPNKLMGVVAMFSPSRNAWRSVCVSWPF